MRIKENEVAAQFESARYRRFESLICELGVCKSPGVVGDSQMYTRMILVAFLIFVSDRAEDEVRAVSFLNPKSP